MRRGSGSSPTANRPRLGIAWGRLGERLALRWRQVGCRGIDPLENIPKQGPNADVFLRNEVWSRVGTF